MKSDKFFNDKWLYLVGIPLVGAGSPFLFGLELNDPDCYKWVLISLIATSFSWITSRKLVTMLWERFPWEMRPWIHILFNILYILLFSVLIKTIISQAKYLFMEPAQTVREANTPSYFGIMAIFVFTITIHEAIFLFFKWKRELTRTAYLEKENIQSKFEALKNHVNPHFLFNNLGTIASLINTDPEKAGQYVNEFSRIYRYLLEVNSNDLVTVEEELNFIGSYIFLQKIRYGDGFVFINNIDKKYYTNYLLPLTLELLIENALKHNATQISQPLRVEMYVDEPGWLTVKNNYMPRHIEESTKTGLVNLNKRYCSFLNKAVSFYHNGQFFTVRIPLISAE